jgi:hypothetical protein
MLIEDDEDDDPVPSPSTDNDGNNSFIIFILRRENRGETGEDDDEGYTRTTGHHDTLYDKYGDFARISQRR